MIIKFISDLFIDFKFVSYGSFRIIRDSDIEFIDEAEDLVTTFENQLKQRRYGRVTLLEISKTMPLDLKKMILNSLKIKNEYILIHLDEKFKDIIDINENLNEALLNIKNNLNKKIFLTSFNNFFEYYNRLNLVKKKINEINHEVLLQSEILIIEDIPINDFQTLIENSYYNISCHCSSSTHI